MKQQYDPCGTSCQNSSPFSGNQQIPNGLTETVDQGTCMLNSLLAIISSTLSRIMSEGSNIDMNAIMSCAKKQNIDRNLLPLYHAMINMAESFGYDPKTVETSFQIISYFTSRSSVTIPIRCSSAPQSLNPNRNPCDPKCSIKVKRILKTQKDNTFGKPFFQNISF